MSVVHAEVSPPKAGLALTVRRGQHLRVTDLEGKQVVDTALFNAENPREKLSTSSSRTRYVSKPGGEYVPRDRLTEGDTLMSTIWRPMRHRFLYESFGLGPHDGGHENIAPAVAPYGLLPEDIPDTMDLFMNYHHDCARGRWVIGEPVSKPGDDIEFRAEMDCIVGLSKVEILE